MKIFQCDHCDHPLFFENYKCENCGRQCGYRDSDRRMLSFDVVFSGLYAEHDQKEYKYCKNKAYGVCNWLVEKDDAQEFCRACQLNRTIPNLTDEENFEKWQNLEVAKHRLVYQLLKIGLELPSKNCDENGLCFDFVARQNDPTIMTGHADGVITILLREADSVLREKARRELMEPYRTLIGHLRHEVGHYFWERLVQSDESVLTAFRTLFGDERVHYGDALQAYYNNGAPDDWQQRYISKYASAHPWEDWAETWAHYLHIMDMVETAYFFGLKVQPLSVVRDMKTEAAFDPYTIASFETIILTCVPLSFAVNSINRAMGLPDVYPFVIAPAVVHKMSFIHSLIYGK
jgi:hypothetical protein